MSRMLTVLGLTAAYMVVEVVAGVYSGSLALLADAGHMLSDVASLLLALLAVRFSEKPATPGKTYGYYRSEILAGLVNGVLLLGISFFIGYEALRRLGEPPHVMSVPMFVVALMGLGVNLVSLKLLGKTAGHSLNVKAAYLEVLGDFLATIAVLFASITIMITKWYVADPLISCGIGLMILPRTWALVSECTNILMEGAPGHIDLGKLRQSMLQVKGVVDVHDIHVWTITSGLDAMSAHVTISGDCLADVVLSQITRITQDDFWPHPSPIPL